QIDRGKSFVLHGASTLASGLLRCNGKSPVPGVEAACAAALQTGFILARRRWPISGNIPSRI
ncbi:MAG: hypothetical protein AAB150_14650, partial [Pseudomonadota bacterium]